MRMKISGIRDEIVRGEMEDYSIGYSAMVVVAKIDRTDKKLLFTKVNEKECTVEYI